MSRVTVVPADRLVIVDGQALTFEFSAPERMHALQWDGKQGHIEWLGSGDEPPYNDPLAADSYAGQVAPYVELWEEEKARLEQAAADAKIIEATAGKNIVKQIYVPKKLVNFVVK